MISYHRRIKLGIDNRKKFWKSQYLDLDHKEIPKEIRSYFELNGKNPTRKQHLWDIDKA